MIKRPFRIRTTSSIRNPCRYKSSRIHESVANYNSEKKFAQALKRNERRVKEYENAIEVSKQYKQHRSNIIEILQDGTNVDAMFTNDAECEITNYKDMCHSLGNQGYLTYSNVEMRNAIMLVANMLLESVAIELKLRNVKVDHDIEQFINDIKVSSNFISLESYRVNFHSYKSSQWLSASQKDAGLHLGLHQPTFKSSQCNDSEIIQSLDAVFDQYMLSHPSSDKDVPHIRLAVQIIRILLSSHNHTPTIKLWMYLLDKFGDCNLLNYQQVIYLSLFQYKHQPTVLADPPPNAANSIFAPLMADHFVHLVEKHPDILISLLKYQVLRKDERMFLELLSLLTLDKIAQEMQVIKSPMLSKSKYKLPKYIPGGLDLDTRLLTISRKCMYQIMQMTIDLQLYEYLDLLFNKIVLHSRDKDSIELNYVEDVLVEGKVFDAELLSIMLDAAVKSDDLGRVVWLLPFIDEYIEDVMELCGNLQSQLLQTLRFFNLEGKLKSYEEIFRVTTPHHSQE
ncbi:hypothetical protein KGF57_004204 [Candida theae]|uniref:Uncharacterized protein n=1 Tax=Candida theae TaxID=1198502 RepID=A0AAD5BBP2_9ASCO|nr:uncharacterized protein KGF57_004204 [Candida theae]KAI5952112.1 hypothetical protein KGF57_004204 [Candida theae]